MSTKPKRKPSAWILAVKEFNEDNTDTWCVPRKGGKSYTKVKAMADRIKKGEPKPPKEPKTRSFETQTDKPKEYVTLKPPVPPPVKKKEYVTLTPPVPPPILPKIKPVMKK